MMFRRSVVLGALLASTFVSQAHAVGTTLPAAQKPAHDSRLIDDSELERDPVSAATLIGAANTARLAANWNRLGTAYGLSDAFALHSRPGSPLRIYLDFNGHTTTSPRWAWPGTSVVSRPLDWDQKVSYSPAERTNIAEVWSRVAEYFAPFDVDVTTEQPADSDLIKSNPDDPRFGIRVVITPDNPWDAGGMAVLNSFGDPTLAPAYCYCANYFTVDQALIIAHEVGHTLGLDHDGDSTHEYYGGQGSWAPIMGCGYGKPVQQWSKGEYDDANNKEDDLAMIARSIPYIADTAPDTRSDAVALTSRQMRGTISSANDSDWYSFDVTSGTLDLSVSGEFGSNGDFAAELWHEGSLVQTVDPAGLAVTHAQLDVDAGAYQLRIFGTGALDVLIDGYSSYGSIGGYTLNVNDVVVLNEPSDISVSTSRTAAAVGESITFTASSTANPAFAGANLAWEFSDGTTTTGATVSRQMSSASLTATVTMTDASGERTSDPISVRLIKPPVATISMTTNAVKPKVAARFSATAVDPDSQDVTFSWVFSNQTRATGASASATLSTTGIITATVTARNTDGATSTATTQVKVTTNSPPAVSASAVASRRAAPATISFDTVAKDPEGTALSYRWEFPKEELDPVARPTYWAYHADTYRATVIVTDADGLWTSKTVTLTLKPNSAPEITSAVVTPDSAAAWTPLTFKAVAKDVDGHELSYFWIFPDDNGWPYPFPQYATTATATHRPLKPGTYTAILRVEDEGYLDVKQEVTYTVGENHAPTVMIKPMTLSKPAPAAFTLIAAGSDQDNQTLSYSWAFSDGTTATGTTVSKTLTAASDLTATVTATDPEGLTATQAVTLTATANHAPTVKLALTGASTRVAPATFAFAASGTDIDGQRLTYSWSFGDSTTGSGASIQKAFSTPGTHLVTVTATDPGGLTATASLTVTVTANRAPVITSAAVTPATATAGTLRRFTVVASDPDKQSIQIKWTFPDGTSSTTAAVSKVFSTPGSYRATVTVTDPGSLATSTTVSFVVS